MIFHWRLYALAYVRQRLNIGLEEPPTSSLKSNFPLLFKGWYVHISVYERERPVDALLSNVRYIYFFFLSFFRESLRKINEEKMYFFFHPRLTLYNKRKSGMWKRKEKIKVSRAKKKNYISRRRVCVCRSVGLRPFSVGISIRVTRTPKHGGVFARDVSLWFFPRHDCNTTFVLPWMQNNKRTSICMKKKVYI